MTEDLKPNKHVKYILNIAYKRIWAISRLKSFGVANKDIFHFYFLKIRSVLENLCPVFQPMLTQENREDIERIQKIIVKIVLGQKYDSYEEACVKFSLPTLEERRKKLCLNFALKCLKTEKFKSLFHENNEPSYNLQTVRTKFKVPFCNKARYEKSPIPYMVSLLNDYFHLTSQFKM